MVQIISTHLCYNNNLNTFLQITFYYLHLLIFLIHFLLVHKFSLFHNIHILLQKIFHFLHQSNLNLMYFLKKYKYLVRIHSYLLM